MRGLMMDFPLTLSAILRRAETRFPHKPVVSRRADRGVHRSTYGEIASRARRLATALRHLGIGPGRSARGRASKSYVGPPRSCGGGIAPD